jgi:hypothetical protein
MILLHGPVTVATHFAIFAQTEPTQWTTTTIPIRILTEQTSYCPEWAVHVELMGKQEFRTVSLMEGKRRDILKFLGRWGTPKMEDNVKSRKE